MNEKSNYILALFFKEISKLKLLEYSLVHKGDVQMFITPRLYPELETERLTTA